MQNEHKISLPLTITDCSGKRLESAPEDTTIGVVNFHKWPIIPVKPIPDLFDDSTAYLIKINYELELVPNLPPMPWFEVGIHFEGDTSATVLDALPHGTRTPLVASSYTINNSLQLVPTTDQDSTTQIYLPAIDERVDLYGIGGTSSRWRHSTEDPSGVHPGSRAAWALLLIDKSQIEQRCRLEVRYAMASTPETDYWPTHEPAEFTITLSNATLEPTVTPSRAALIRAEPRQEEPSLFFCYAHESTEFKRDVEKLAGVLMHEGLDPHVDQFENNRRKNWGHWSLNQFMNCDFTLVIASPMCRRVGDGLEKYNHQGLHSEMTQLESLYQRHPEWREYVLPVILPGQSKEGIPLFLGPEKEDYYEVYDYTPEGIADLMNVIRKTGPRRWRFNES